MEIILKSLMIVLFCGIICVGCGRKGTLELPSSVVVQKTPETFPSKSQGDKFFILDRLIQ
ncbi:hypothetical protein [Bartonella sp. CB189]|uniref:hypothetical protein n=1 Tax=Bartonella sp. CB189 TaxID=3112254 RepID=UPI002F963A58